MALATSSKSYEDLLDRCREAWNSLVDRLWRIMSIGFHQWIFGL